MSNNLLNTKVLTKAEGFMVSSPKGGDTMAREEYLAEIEAAYIEAIERGEEFDLFQFDLKPNEIQILKEHGALWKFLKNFREKYPEAAYQIARELKECFDKWVKEHPEQWHRIREEEWQKQRCRQGYQERHKEGEKK